MLDKLNDLETKYELLTAKMNDPAVYADPDAYASLAKEQKTLLPIVEAYRRWKQYRRDAEDAAGDEELRELYAEAKEGMERTETELKTLLLPRDPDDGRNVILELRAGTGGEEAALFAADLYRMYAHYAESRGWRVEVLRANQTELGGFKELICSVAGENVYSRLKYEAGSHCVKRVPETESSGRIQTSTATAAVLPEIGEIDFAIDPADPKIDVFRASGAGGQKVNKTESAVRVTHLPTGTVVECQNERSQYQNKDRALAVLRARLYEAERTSRDAAVARARRAQVGTGGRSEKIRTYFFLRGQVVDQRLSGAERSFQLNDILNGKLDPLIDALTMADQAEKLRAQEGEA